MIGTLLTHYELFIDAKIQEALTPIWEKIILSSKSDWENVINTEAILSGTNSENTVERIKASFKTPTEINYSPYGAISRQVIQDHINSELNLGYTQTKLADFISSNIIKTYRRAGLITPYMRKRVYILHSSSVSYYFLLNNYRQLIHVALEYSGYKKTPEIALRDLVHYQQYLSEFAIKEQEDYQNKISVLEVELKSLQERALSEQLYTW